MTLDFRAKVPWDLDNLDTETFLPSFPMPASVVFARLSRPYAAQNAEEVDPGPLAPGQVEIWSTPEGTKESVRTIEPLHHDDGKFHSPYAEHTMQGPTIVDRRLFFVSTSPNNVMAAAPGTQQTHPRTTKQDKKHYLVNDLDNMVLHDDNLFEVYLGESMVPFVALPPLTAGLPASKQNLDMPLDHSDCERDEKTGRCKKQRCEVDADQLDQRMRERWAVMERLWIENRGKSDTKSLTQNLNWLNKLTNQLNYLSSPGMRPVRIGYTTSGRPTAALIGNDQAIVDTKLYQVTCRSLKEAYYLLAIINSTAMFRAVEPLMSRGLYGGARDLHKHLWKLPIPEFDTKDKLHAKLASLGQKAEKEAGLRIQEMNKGREEPVTSDAGREELRNNWQRPMNPPRRHRNGPERFSQTTAEIETAVAELLSA